MNPRSRFESDSEYLRRLEDENRRLEYNNWTREQAAFEAACSTGYDDDEAIERMEAEGT